MFRVLFKVMPLQRFIFFGCVELQKFLIIVVGIRIRIEFSALKKILSDVSNTKIHSAGKIVCWCDYFNLWISVFSVPEK